MRSTLAQGHVHHRRIAPKAYTFKYGVYYVLLDLDEIDEVERRIIPFRHNAPNVLSFRDSDHMAREGETLRMAVNRRLTVHGLDPAAVRVSLLTNTRVAGYIFNPVSFYFVRDRASDALVLVIAEVHNTHGEEHVYELVRESADGVYRSRTDKQFYVSPFIEMEARYVFEVRELREGAYDLRIDEYRPDSRGPEARPFFQAQLQVSPVPLTNANVARMLARYPLITLQTIGLIHWQGLKLWLRGVKFRKHTPKEPALR